jgi:hypothetical protein
MSEKDDEKKNKICFDWCAIQHLSSKCQKKEVDFEKIKKRFSLILTCVNISEASVISNQDKRFSKFNFCYELFNQSGTILDNPEEILKAAYFYYLEKTPFIIPLLNKNVFDQLSNPQNYPVDYVEIQLDSHRKINQNIRDINDEIRNNHISKEFRKINKNLSLKEYLDDVYNNDNALNEYLLIIKKRIGLEDDQVVLGADFIKANIIWKLYLCALLTGSYLCTYIQKKTTEPQFMDLRQITYLLFCDYFVTDDVPLEGALNKIVESDLIKLNTRIIDLNQFLTLIK